MRTTLNQLKFCAERLQKTSKVVLGNSRFVCGFMDVYIRRSWPVISVLKRYTEWLLFKFMINSTCLFVDIRWYIHLYIYIYIIYHIDNVMTYTVIYTFHISHHHIFPLPDPSCHRSPPGIGSRNLGCCGTSGNSLRAGHLDVCWMDPLLNGMDDGNKNGWKRLKTKRSIIYASGDLFGEVRRSFFVQQVQCK